MKILKSFATFLGFTILLVAIFFAGVRAGAATIQRSCDNMDESRTVINGHAYFCGDYDAVSRAMAVLQHQRGA